MNNFEFDKIIVAIILSLLVLVVSDNLGKLFYGSEMIIDKPGYNITLSNAPNTDSPKAASLPEVLDIKMIMASADATKGEEVFKKCSICHTIAKNEPNKVGPNLWNIIGSISASKIGFAYSDAMMQRKNAGKTWTYEEIYRFLFSPKQYVAGTKMAFAGIKNDQDRANVILYLRSMADTIQPLP